ncbi:MAG TPA: response regulator transcription factor [Arcobacter sp.]|jgi:DNA-binding response OmpR family regulator|nr:response regulator transcription factor [Arcobacter sp.]
MGFNSFEDSYMKQINTIIIDDKNEIRLDEFQTTVISEFHSLKKAIFNEDISLILINKELQNNNPYEIISFIKNNGFNIPVIVLSSNENEEELVKIFDAGCDDYISKKTNKSIIKAKIKSIVSRFEKIQEDIHIENLSYIGKSNHFLYNDKVLDLTKKEKMLLLEFMRNQNKVLSREHLISKIWKELQVQQKSLNVLITRLKHKIDPENKKSLIKTVYGKGYIFTF